MGENSESESVKEWAERSLPDYQWGVAPFFSSVKEMEEALKRGEGYKRSGYALVNNIAMMFAKKVAGPNWSGRLYNSGMAAITTAIEAVGLKSGDQAVVGKVLYPEATQIYKGLGRFGIEVKFVDSSNISKIKIAVCDRTRLVHMETIGNGLRMPLLDFEELLNYCWQYSWQRNLTIILDNTFPTFLSFNPFPIYGSLRRKKGRGGVNFVYIESLSKFYRRERIDEVTAGVIIGSPNFIKDCDRAMARLGTYLPAESLKVLPADLAERPCQVVSLADEKGREIIRWLKGRPEMKFIARGVNGIIYAVLNTRNRRVARRFADALDCPKASSFGHSVTTILPLGNIRKSYPAGAIRIAVGWEEPSWQVIAKLEKAFVSALWK